ncbi:MAG: hypothetical protein JOZ16_12315 [Methylobacteriaceae bacterium]|nr:hypothetical protein [Methylobacteriaceae bacterium]
MQQAPENPSRNDAPAPKAEDGERIDAPRPTNDGAIRGEREDLDAAHEVEEEAARGKV